MYIDNVYAIGVMRTANPESQIKKNEVEFGEILNTEIKKDTFSSMEEILETNHNAKIIDYYSSESLNCIDGLNNVIICQDTLRHMENDVTFKNRILKIIDDCCSPSAIEEVRSLSPPVKSAGVIIYPDGNYLCWIESIYSNRSNESFDHNKDSIGEKNKARISNQIGNIEKELIIDGLIGDSIITDNEEQNNNNVILNKIIKKRRGDS